MVKGNRRLHCCVKCNAYHFFFCVLVQKCCCLPYSSQVQNAITSCCKYMHICVTRQKSDEQCWSHNKSVYSVEHVCSGEKHIAKKISFLASRQAGFTQLVRCLMFNAFNVCCRALHVTVYNVPCRIQLGFLHSGFNPLTRVTVVVP